MHDKRRGFTLIELLIVVAIIGLLGTLAMIALNSSRARPRNAKRVADIQQLRKALELYYSENRTYPVVGTAITLGTGTAMTLCGTGGFAASCTGLEFMGTVPAAPMPEDGGCSAAQNAYSYTGTATTYNITFCLGAVVGAYPAGVHTASETGIR